jgi:glycosyltransferase involved in cell wall biosynthesis
MKVVVLTTSYPRNPGDVAGAFVRDAVEELRRAGADVEVVSPASFRHFGIAYGNGVAANLRRAPWRLLLLPAFLAGFVRAARRAARDADLVHAHWLPTGLVGLATRKPLVVQVWGTDIELARRAPWLFRPVLRRARLVIGASDALTEAARELGARTVRVVPAGVEIPDRPGEPEEPPHILYVGRLSEEKGVRDLAAAASELPLVVVGDGPLRDLVPSSVGFVSRDELRGYFQRAAIVCVPSRREGYGFTAREAMAYGRAVVTTGVGGLGDAVQDDVTGVVVAPHDPAALRAALELLLGNRRLRVRLGAAARAKARTEFAWPAATSALVALYGEVVTRSGSEHIRS